MTWKDEADLVDRAKAGDARACTELVEAHREPMARLVRYFESRFGLPRGMESADAGQEAWFFFTKYVCGKSALAYDHTRGPLWGVVRRSLLRRLARWKDEMDEVPKRVREARVAVMWAFRRLEQEAGGTPSVAAVAAATGLSEEVVAAVLGSRRRTDILGEDGADAIEGELDPGAEERFMQAWCRLAARCLIPIEKAGKYIVLYTLPRYLHLRWEDVCRLLQVPNGVLEQDGEEVDWGPRWEEVHARLGLPAAVPAAWSEVVRLFAVPPPTLTPVAAGSRQRAQGCASVLRTYHTRCAAEVRACWTRLEGTVADPGL